MAPKSVKNNSDDRSKRPQDSSSSSSSSASTTVSASTTSASSSSGRPPPPSPPPSSSLPPPPQPFEIALARRLENKFRTLHDAFLDLDSDRDGYVTRSDLKVALHNHLGVDLNEGQMNSLFERFAWFEVDHRDAARNGEEKEEEDADGGDGGSNGDGTTRTTKRRRGIRYGEFVRYVNETASSHASSSSLYGSTLNLRIAENGMMAAPAIAMKPAEPRKRRLYLRPPADAERIELRRALRQLLRQSTKSKGGLKERDLFLSMDVDRSGKVTPDEFRSWTESHGMILTINQTKTLLGEHWKDEGVDLTEFAMTVEELDDVDDTAILPWEMIDEDEVRRRNKAVKAAEDTERRLAEEERRRREALTRGTDDVKTDDDIVRTVAGQIYKKKMGLVEAFRKYDVEKSRGGLDSKELCAALRDAGLDVSEERVRKLLDKFDRTGDGRLTKGDFVRLIASGWQEEEEEEEEAEKEEKEKKGKSAMEDEDSKPPAAAAAASTSKTKVERPSDAAAVNERAAKRESLKSSFHGDENAEDKERCIDRLDEDDVETIMNFRDVLEEERLLARKTFQSMDVDQSRSLSPKELKDGFVKLGINVSDEHIDHIMKKFDTEGTGQLKYYQFLNLISANLDEYHSTSSS